MSDDRKPRSLFWPLLLIALGVFLVLINVGTIKGTTWDNIVRYWPVILILGGLDGVYRRDGWVGSVVLLGLGTVLLLGNLHYLPVNAWSLLIRLWPVLLVAVGLDVAFGRRSASWNAILRIGIGLLLVAGILWIALTSPFGAGTKKVSFDQTLDGATESQLTFSMPAGKLELMGGAESDMLLSGFAGLPKNMNLDPDYSIPKDGRSSLTLDANGVAFIPVDASTYPWNFKMNSEIPIILRTNAGAGNIDVDLSGVKVNEYSQEMGVGVTKVTLPCTQQTNAQIQVAIGSVELFIPKGCDVNINLDTGLVSQEIPADYIMTGDSIRNELAEESSSTLNVKVELAIGRLEIVEIP